MIINKSKMNILEYNINNKIISYNIRNCKIPKKTNGNIVSYFDQNKNYFEKWLTTYLVHDNINVNISGIRIIDFHSHIYNSNNNNDNIDDLLSKLIFINCIKDYTIYQNICGIYFYNTDGEIYWYWNNDRNTGLTLKDNIKIKSKDIIEDITNCIIEE